MDPVLLITNAEAGGHDAEALEQAVTVLRAATDVEVAKTSNPGELDGVLHRRASRLVVVAGGDGSLHAVVAALHRRHELAATTLALIPLGTGNDFARGVGVPLEPEDAARVVLEGRPRPIDLLVDCTGEVVVNAVHIGVGADAGREAMTWKLYLGRFGYLVGAAIAGAKAGGIRLQVLADDEVIADLDRPVLQVGIGNGPNIGGGTVLMPDAAPDDGVASVVVSFATTPWAKLGYTLHLRRGEHHRRHDVAVTRAATVRVSGQSFHCNADGEVYGPERSRQWRVEPGAFRMVLPDG
ncbi:MAG: diacylglycerol kinase [Actinomycetota bacterium]|nr:diacylglycerol kinase [Actinomycetota bacterium]